MTINAIKRFGLVLERSLIESGNEIDSVETIEFDPNIRPAYSWRNGYLLAGPTILLNDVSHVNYHLNFFNFDEGTGDWQAILYLEIVDHFGLDDKDPTNTITIPRVPLTILGIPVRTPPVPVQYQTLDSGFASWWILQKNKEL